MKASCRRVLTKHACHEPGDAHILRPGSRYFDKGLAVGIDLGTTDSLAAVFTDDGDVEMVSDDQGNILLPSAISFSGSQPSPGTNL
ncbi:MAG: Hsp70 family protein [Pseudomonadota bacterium]